MKILLVSHGSGPYGAERVLLAFAEGLAGRGHDVVLDLPHTGAAAVAANGLKDVRVRVSGRHRLPRSWREAIAFFLTAPAAVARTRRAIRETGPDLVWLSSMYNPWAAVAAAFTKRPVVWHLHEHPLRQPGGTAMAALMGLAATRLVAVSESLAAAYGRYPWLRDRLTTVRNPLLHEIEPVPYPPAGRFTIGYIGQLEPIKRVTDLVAAVAQLHAVEAVIVGDGKARDVVQRAVEKAGVGDRVELVGYKEDLAPQLRRFHCVAIPGTRESFGLVGLEAMAAGVPVVAARAGALPEVLRDAALYHDPGDPGDLASQIDRLRAEPALAAALRDRGLNRAGEYRRDRWLDDMEGIIALTVDARSGG